MYGRIGRLEDITYRNFPPITPNLYQSKDSSDLIPNQLIAKKFLGLAQLSLTWQQRFLGWQLDEVGQMGRLLKWHGLAFEAELASQWDKADFFWQQVMAGLKSLMKKKGLWEVLAIKLTAQGGMPQIDPIELHQRFVEEILVDTHCAFFNGYVEANEILTLEHRAFRHFDYLCELIDMFEFLGKHQMTIMGLPFAIQMKLYREANNIQQALEICNQLLTFFPDHIEYQAVLGELYMVDTLAKLSNKSNTNIQDAIKVQNGIYQLEELLSKYPYNVTIFQLIGLLHKTQAIKLGNGGSLSDALVEAQKAITYYPSLESATTILNQLIDIMKGLQDDVLALTPQAMGERMRSEAHRGFSPLNAYVASRDAKATRRAYQVAQGRKIWQEMGLSQPVEDWDNQAVDLLEVLVQIINKPPTTEAEIPEAWNNAKVNHPNLIALDSTPIHIFLKSRLFESEDANPDVNTENPPWGVLANPPLLKPASIKKQPGSEPFKDWLFSSHGKRIKVQAVVAIILLLAAGWFTDRAISGLKYRDDGYKQIIEASTRQDYFKVIEGAEIFLANPPLRGIDPREHEVIDLYRESFIHWFVEQGDELTPEALAHINQYRQLMVEQNK